MQNFQLTQLKKQTNKHTVQKLLLGRDNAVVSCYSFALDQVLSFIQKGKERSQETLYTLLVQYVVLQVIYPRYRLGYFSVCAFICFQCAVPRLARMPSLQHYFLIGSNPSISNIAIYLQTEQNKNLKCRVMFCLYYYTKLRQHAMTKNLSTLDWLFICHSYCNRT